MCTQHHTEQYCPVHVYILLAMISCVVCVCEAHCCVETIVSWGVLVLSAVHPMSPWNHQALVSLRGDLKLRVLMETGLRDKLEKAAGGFMDEHEAQTVKEQPGNSKQMDKVIDILLGKANKDFTTFLKMLQDSNNKVWAEELEKRAEQFKKEGMYVCVQREESQKAHGPMVQCICHAVCAHVCVWGACVHVVCVCVCVCTCSTCMYTCTLYISVCIHACE